MTRNRASAKKAGTEFETLVAHYLRHELDDDRIERRARNGALDRGDIGGVRVHGKRVVVECKNVATMALASWVAQADIERSNDDAFVGVAVHKRKGTTDPAQQYVTMTLGTLAQLIGG